MAAHVTPETLVDATVVDVTGTVIGKVGGVLLSDATGEPTWVTVTSGLLGITVVVIPLAGAVVVGGTVTVPFPQARVKNAPRHASGAKLAQAEEAALRRHYGVPDDAPGLRNDDPTSENGATHHHGRTYSGNATNDRPPAANSPAG